MKRRGSQLVVAALFAALIFACAGEARTQASAVTRAQLALMPLPREVIRSQVTGVVLNDDSGVVSNKEAADNANGNVTAAHLAAAGRRTGYDLEYGDGAPALQGVSEVSSEVDLYSSAATATAGLAFTKKDAADVGGIPKGAGITVSFKDFAATGFNGPTFADQGEISLRGAPPLYGGDLGFQVGSLVATIEIAASTPTEVRALLFQDGRAFEARINNVLAGRTTGSPVALPGKQKAGPVPGFDLKSFALTPSDLGSATVQKQGYQLDDDLNPLSEYARAFEPGGSFASIQDTVALFRTPAAAQFECALLGTVLTTRKGLAVSGALDGHAFTLQRLSISIGDQADGAIVNDRSPSGTNINFVFMVIRFGRTIDYLVLVNRGTVPISRPAIAAIEKHLAARARG